MRKRKNYLAMTDQVVFNTSPSSSGDAAAQLLGASDLKPVPIFTTSAPGPKGNLPGAPPIQVKVYDGGFACAKESGVLLHLGNGGAGQIGLIAALANTFIQHQAAKGNSPFQVRPPHNPVFIVSFNIFLTDSMVSWGYYRQYQFFG
jgi:hypothetical protein